MCSLYIHVHVGAEKQGSFQPIATDTIAKILGVGVGVGNKIKGCETVELKLFSWEKVIWMSD